MTTQPRADVRPERAARRIATMGAGIVLAGLFGLPLLWMLVSSIRPANDILGHLFPMTLESVFPRKVTLINYATLINDGFLLGVQNTLVATLLTVLLGLAICIPAAFALAVLEFRGRTFVFALLVGAFIVPFDILAFPLALLVAKVGLANRVIALVLPLVCNGFAIFLLRQFFMAIPRSLYEAARVDGASIFRILWTVYLPISRPALVGAGIMFFVSQWQAFLWPLLVAPMQATQVANVRLALMWQPYDPVFGQILAGATILFVLPATFVLFFQRYFIESIATSGISG